MAKYSEEVKQSVLIQYLAGYKSTHAILADTGIPKSTFYSWLNEYNSKQSQPKKLECTQQAFRTLTNRVAKLECIIEILKTVDCSAQSPLNIKLSELERLFGKYSIHALCEALDVSRGTFYNHIYRNKRDTSWYAKRREELKLQIQDIYDESRQRFGSGKITAILQNRGVKVSLEMVRELMRDIGLISIRQEAKTCTIRNH